MTRSLRSVAGSSQDSHRALRPRLASAGISPASSPSPSINMGQPASTILGWKTSGRASFMRASPKGCYCGMMVGMHAIEVPQTGGPEVLRNVDKPQPIPGPGQVLIKAEAIGVNFIDTYFRSGQYPRE